MVFIAVSACVSITPGFSRARNWSQLASRCGLHVHHIEFRSHTGKKSRAESNSPPNLITTCFVHHRMIHAGNIGLTGRAPAELHWRRPELMESAADRFNELAAEAFEPDDFELPGQEQGETQPQLPPRSHENFSRM